jgi:hypothetical protein
MLAGVAEGSLTEAAYQRVRTSLASLGDLLENLESGLQPTAGASKGLRLQIAKIDTHMQAQRSSSSYASSVVNPSPMTASYPPGQRSALNSHQPPLGHTYHNLPVQTSVSQYQVPQEVITAWPWSFEPNDSQHPANNLAPFNGWWIDLHYGNATILELVVLKLAGYIISGVLGPIEDTHIWQQWIQCLSLAALWPERQKE